MVGEEAMARTASGLTPEEIAAYRRAARLRWERQKQELLRRRERAWHLVRRVAEFLRGQFGATRVVLFGSLVHAGCFTPWSDVDVAAWGIRPEDTFRAIGAVMDLEQEIKVDLVDVTACRPSLLAVIEQEGVEV
jgi:predicted nucleotidyltransferase